MRLFQLLQSVFDVGTLQFHEHRHICVIDEQQIIAPLAFSNHTAIDRNFLNFVLIRVVKDNFTFLLLNVKELFGMSHNALRCDDSHATFSSSFSSNSMSTSLSNSSASAPETLSSRAAFTSPVSGSMIDFIRPSLTK